LTLAFALCVACGGSIAGPADAAPNPVRSQRDTLYRVPDTIDATGAEDVTAQLTAFIAAVPDSSTIVFAPAATYRVEGTLLLNERRSLRFLGNGATIVQRTTGAGTAPAPAFAATWPRRRSVWAAVGGSNLLWRGFALRGANPHAGLADAAYVVALEAQHGFDLIGVRHVEIDSVTVTDVYGDFVYMGMTGGLWTGHVHIHNSTFKRNGRQGFAITGAEDVLIENNVISDVRRTDIDLEPNSTNGGARRITLRSNRFGPTRLNFLSSLGQCGTITGVTIENNTLAGQALKIDVRPPPGCRRSSIRIVGNYSDTQVGVTRGFLMKFMSIDGLIVRGNVNPLQAGREMKGVLAAQSCGVEIAANSFPNSVAEAEVVEYNGCDT
jgi:hypothetical protein